MNNIEPDNYLKFFYLIDTEKLVQDILNKLSPEFCSEDLFSCIFSKIEEACYPYLEFVYSPASFNHTDQDSTSPSRISLLRLVLKNHCIIHGFINLLKKSETADESKITISGANDIKLKTGYFKTEGFSNSPSLLPDGTEQKITIAQNYNENKKRFITDNSRYSYQILQNYSCESNKNGFLIIPSYHGNWGCFIYNEPLVKTVNDNIYALKGPLSIKNKTLIKNYNNLLTACTSWCNHNHLISTDKLLFEHAMESIYGFSFFGYASKLLKNMYAATFDDTKLTIKDLEGSLMLSHIQQTAQLPITYNRSVFLEHCLYSVINSKYLKSQEHQRKNNSLFSHISRKPVPKESLITSGFDHMEKYLQKLKYVAIPLLENLWDVIIDKLNDPNKQNAQHSISIKTYCDYIEKNYFVISQDYSHFFESEKILYDFYEDSLYTNPSETSYALYRDYNYTNNLKSEFERDSFTHLLLDYFKPERLSIPQPSLYELLIAYSGTNHKPADLSAHTEELNFHKYHRENILSFAENITPFIR